MIDGETVAGGQGQVQWQGPQKKSKKRAGASVRARAGTSARAGTPKKKNARDKSQEDLLRRTCATFFWEGDKLNKPHINATMQSHEKVCVHFGFFSRH